MKRTIVLILLVIVVLALTKLFFIKENVESTAECSNITCTKQECLGNTCCNECGCSSWTTKDKTPLEVRAIKKDLPYAGVIDGCGQPIVDLQINGYKKGRVFHANSWSYVSTLKMDSSSE